MLGSVALLAVEVGEGDVVGAAVDVGVELAALEGEASGLPFPPHPASNRDSASGTANIATEFLFATFQLTAFPTP